MGTLKKKLLRHRRLFEAAYVRIELIDKARRMVIPVNKDFENQHRIECGPSAFGGLAGLRRL